MTRDLKRAVLLPMLLAAAGGEVRAAEVPALGSPPATRPEQAWIGPYRLVAEIGEGGMGTVYLAEQAAPVFRQVAVKVARAGDAEPTALIERFLLERQALAVGEHEHVARLYDAGTTADGAPWFAMEYVPGEPITAYCDARRLDLGARLRLFADVCDAVQHLHEVGVQHRDLKPDNVLVVERGGRPVPKIIDLGLAAFTGIDDDTEAGGTPTHMAPEQFTMPSDRIDERADVHGLGVLLYELLVGQLPYVRRPAATADEFSLGGEQIALPSACLDDVDVRRLAAARRTSPRRLRAALRRGLDDLATRTVAADRDRRPPCAADLASATRVVADREAQRASRIRTGLATALTAAAAFAAGVLLV